MTISFIDSFVNPGSIGVLETWQFQITSSEAAAIIAAPTTLEFTLSGGGTITANGIYPEATVNPYGLLWTVAQQPGTGNWYIGLVVALNTFFGSHTISDITGATVDGAAPPSSNITITMQPTADSLLAAYRPIIYRARVCITGSSSTNYIAPVVYCDIYLNDIYYRTCSKINFINDNGTAPEYEFDIQEPIQEALTFNLPEPNGDSIQELSSSFKSVKVKFRNAKKDADGFIYSEQLEPIQATSSSMAVSGGGIESDTCFVFNSTIQHEENQNFEQLLASYKTGVWNNESYPLTKRPQKYYLGKNDSSHFPLATKTDIASMCLNYKEVGSTYQTTCTSFAATCDPISGLTLSVVDNENGSQTFHFEFDPITVETMFTIQLFNSSGDMVYEENPYVNGLSSYDIIFYFLGIYDVKVKISDCFLDYNPTNIFTAVGTPEPVVSMPSSNTLTISRTSSEAANPSTRFVTVTPAILANGYSNTNGYGIDYIGITVPIRGQWTNDGVLITTSTAVPYENVVSGKLKYWPTGVDNDLPFTSFAITNIYGVRGLYGSSYVTVNLNINFTAL